MSVPLCAEYLYLSAANVARTQQQRSCSASDSLDGFWATEIGSDNSRGPMSNARSSSTRFSSTCGI